MSAISARDGPSSLVAYGTSHPPDAKVRWLVTSKPASAYQRRCVECTIGRLRCTLNLGPMREGAYSIVSLDRCLSPDWRCWLGVAGFGQRSAKCSTDGSSARRVGVRAGCWGACRGSPAWARSALLEHVVTREKAVVWRVPVCSLRWSCVSPGCIVCSADTGSPGPACRRLSATLETAFGCYGRGSAGSLSRRSSRVGLLSEVARRSRCMLVDDGSGLTGSLCTRSSRGAPDVTRSRSELFSKSAKTEQERR